MDGSRAWSNRVVCAAALFAGFGVAHLVDDFLSGVPAEFNLSNEASQLLALVFFGALTGLIALAGRGSRGSYLGLMIIGILLAAAGQASPPGAGERSVQRRLSWRNGPRRG